MLDKKTRALGSLLSLLILLVACRSMQNYQEPNKPLFSGDYATRPPNFNGEIKVVSWNIKFSQGIEKAIEELSTVEELQGADIILLQEMDEEGVEKIALALNYNYVYFPASVHSRHGKNFGNAILARWPMSAAAKVILPHTNPKNGQVRIAARARVAVGESELLVYSVHTETYFLSRQKRTEQIDALRQDIGEDDAHVIVGGDFNTFSRSDVTALEQNFQQDGLERVSKGSGPTFKYGPLVFRTDHIFARGMSAIETGVWPDTEASDHFPMWVDLSILFNINRAEPK